MKIVFVVSEAMPFASTGGLAEVAYSLPIALQKLGAKVITIMPLYKVIKDEYKEKLTFIDEINISLGWRRQYCGIYYYKHENIDYYFVDNEQYYNREKLYSYFDDGERFAFFSKSIYHVLKTISFDPDIIHCHDHQTALAILYYKIATKKLPKFVFTIHNIEYQGKYNQYILGDIFGLDNKFLDLVSFDGKINLIKTGIEVSDLVTTVSNRYKKELTYSQFSHGLEIVINNNKNKLIGILNGIDYDFYNSKDDGALYKNYDFKTISDKQKNKEYLQKIYQLNPIDVPLICMITRLAEHKGIDLVIDKIDEIMNMNLQMIILGSGDEHYNNYFKEARNRYNNLVYIENYNVDKAKQIYSGADFLLMPSRIEPCGLSQMIALRYGTLPIVRATGGLFDSIKNSYGFLFKRFDSNEMLEKIKEALLIYQDKTKLYQMIKEGFKQDFSWGNQAELYLNAYLKLIQE